MKLEIFSYTDGNFLLTKLAHLSKRFRCELPESGLLDQDKTIYVNLDKCRDLRQLEYAAGVFDTFVVKGNLIDGCIYLLRRFDFTEK